MQRHVWLALTFIFALLGAVSPLRAHEAVRPAVPGHPSDGPDVDLRVRLEEGRITLQAIMNLAFCDEVAGSPRRSDDAVTPKELARLERDLLRVFEKEAVVAVDGIAVAPREHEAALLPFEPADAEYFPELGMLAVIKVRLTLVYSLTSDPSTVGLTWRLHPIDTALADFVEVPIEVKAEWTAFGDVAIVDLPEDRPEYVWRAASAPARRAFAEVPRPEMATKSDRSALFLTLGAMGLMIGSVLMSTAKGRSGRRLFGALVLVPAMLLLAFGFVGLTRETPTLAPEGPEAARIFAALHGNIYRAFDYAEEERVYDALARSVTGELLDEVYNEIYRSLVLQEHGGAVCRVDEVSRLESVVTATAESAPLASFRVASRWQVRGQVYHWGHTHERTNEYRADYRVVPTEEGWRIDQAKVLEQFRVSATNNGSPDKGTPR